MTAIHATVLLAVLTVAIAESTATNRQLTSVKPKCPGICRVGPGAINIVKQECKKSKVWCAASLKKCVIAPCSKTVGISVQKGFKCVCPECPDKCYGGLKGLKKARKECVTRECHSLTAKNDRCVLQTCVTRAGRDGFKCSCRSAPGTCPNICRRKKIGDALANVECSDENAPLCEDSRRRCEVEDCRIGRKRGKKCGCPLTIPLPCPDVCRYGGQAALDEANRECEVPRTCRDGKCEVRKCTDGRKVGYKCGCKDDVPPKCPDICRYDGQASLQEAKEECEIPRTCTDGRCAVRKCNDGRRFGYKCGCKDDELPKCPDICRFDGKAEEGARLECSNPHFCADGKCDVRKCYRGGLVGYKCGCKDELPPCPEECHIGRSAELKARNDCIPDHFCPEGKCDVRKCFVGDIAGFKCGCKDDDPLKPCPNECRFDADAQEEAKKECSEPRLCFGGECLVRKCFDKETGRGGYKCGCLDEAPPTPCPDNCYTSASGEALAKRECSVPHTCRDGTCDVRKCYVAGRAGHKCGCQDEKPPTGCPGICHGGSSGRGVALKDCDEKITCADSDRLCEVQGCETIDGRDGWECGCPTEPQSCSETCRTDAVGMATVREECARKPFCKDSKQQCELRKCSVRGKPGLQCACPVKAGCSNVCQTTKLGLEAVAKECSEKPLCTPGGVNCVIQSCRVGPRLGRKCACPSIKG